MDELISRKLKNWYARQQPPPGSRERLLNQAALQKAQYAHPEQERLVKWAPILWEILDFISAPMEGETVHPFTASGMWSIHMTVASLRFIL